MKIGIIQYSPEWEALEKNFLTVEDLIDKNGNDEDVIILPEMSLTGFTMNSKQFAEDIDGISVSGFIELSRRVKKHIFAGIIELEDEKIYNSIFHFDNNGLIMARYRKIHPFSFAKEDQSYSRGKETVITKIGKTSAGLSICYDLRFPELYRFYGKNETDIIINIANWPVPRIEHWKLLLRARAIENQTFVIGVNRTGSDPFNDYCGCSSVFSPMGDELLMLDNSAGYFTCEFDEAEAKTTKEKFPFLKDIKLI